MTDKGDTDTRNSRLFHFPPKTFLWRITLVLVLFACFVDALAVLNGLNRGIPFNFAPDGYKRFCEVLAWFPFPIYFILAAFVVHQSWDAFNTAWRTLPHTGVIQRRDNYDLVDAHAVMDRIITNFTWWRVWVLIPVAFIAGTVCTYLDSERERATMMATFFDSELRICCDQQDQLKCMQTTFSGQVARACEAPDFMSKWLWDRLAQEGISATQACELKQCKSVPCSGKCSLDSDTRYKRYLERVSNVRGLEGANSLDDKYLAVHAWQWLPVFLMHIEDLVLISLGWLIFLQCVAHAVFFWIFERMSAANSEGDELCLRLNYKSPLGEFGLEYWNHALNNLYWYFSAALLIPFLSRISQPNLNDLDTSQVVLQYTIPILVATPMITTILARQSRLPACWENHSPEDINAYHSQRLWPLDKNWSSKLGILLAFVLLSISFGINLTRLL